MTTQSFYNELFVGIDIEVPLLDGSQRRYINLDSAASTPPFRCVQDAVNAFLPFYSSVHRGAGFKSQLSTRAFEQARQTVLTFLNANPEEYVCIFGKNTTEAINKLAHRFPFTDKRDVVLVSSMEHHSNDLPWRGIANAVHIGLKPDGRLDESDLEAKLKQYSDSVALVAITGASNVTGYLNPINRIAEKAHAAGAQIVVDTAQYAAHRSINMRPLEDPAHLDYITISAHKMYAPFGTGALVGRRDTFERGAPDYRGGGTVKIVTYEDLVWANTPDRDEAGSPNTVGAIALAAAIEKLTQIGMANVAQHEAELTALVLNRLSEESGIRIYGATDAADISERLGVVALAIDDISDIKVASILSHEFGIGVRNGLFCSHPHIFFLLGMTSEEIQNVRQRIIAGDRSNIPGLLRASFGLYNTIDDVNTLVNALISISRGEYRGIYHQDKATGDYIPEGWAPDFDSYFSFNPVKEA